MVRDYQILFMKQKANEGQKKEQEDIKELLKNIKKQKEMFINIII